MNSVYSGKTWLVLIQGKNE